MGQLEPRLWASSVAGQVGRNIQRARKLASMSAQELSNACEGMGYPIPRSTIANIESGRKETVSLQELLVIAEVLDTPPITLIYYPFDAAEVVEKVPGQKRLTVKAAEEFAFARDASDSTLGRLHESALSLAGMEESAIIFMTRSSGLVAGKIQPGPMIMESLRGAERFDDSDVAQDLARQEAESIQRAAHNLIRKAMKIRLDLSANGVPLWEIPEVLAPLYATAAADSEA